MPDQAHGPRNTARSTGQGRHTRSSDETGLIALIPVVGVPILVGVAMGTAQRDAGNDFYATGAQVIATLFIAIAVELVRQADRRQLPNAIGTLVLIGESWIGFFACIRALAGGASSLTLGLAGAGVTAAVLLLSWSLYEQITELDESTHQQKVMAAAVVITFLITAVVLLIY
jgi:hypothetical protein